MIIDLEAAGLTAAGEMPVGTGRTRQEPDGTWVAFACVADGDLGLYGSGATEGIAVSALENKMRALGALMGSALAEAESRYRLKKDAEKRKETEALTKLMGELMGGGAPKRDALPPKKPDPEGDN